MDSMDCSCLLIMLLLLGVPAAGIALYLWYQRRINKQLADAFTHYRGCLEALKQNPHDPTLREAALQAGRYYSNLTRSNRGVTIFDEVALSNDIAAASARAGQPVGAPNALPSTTQTVEDRLARLKGLFDGGSIDEQEYRDRRAKLLDEV